MVPVAEESKHDNNWISSLVEERFPFFLFASPEGRLTGKELTCRWLYPFERVNGFCRESHGFCWSRDSLESLSRWRGKFTCTPLLLVATVCCEFQCQSRQVPWRIERGCSEGPSVNLTLPPSRARWDNTLCPLGSGMVTPQWGTAGQSRKNN